LNSKHIFPLIGTTSSGKKIYSAYRPDQVEISIEINYKDFSYVDYFETYCVFDYLNVRAYKKYSSDSAEFFIYGLYLDAIRVHLGHHLELIKKEMKLHMVFDVVKLGASLVVVEFKDL
jgi:hypothetical protein